MRLPHESTVRKHNTPALCKTVRRGKLLHVKDNRGMTFFEAAIRWGNAELVHSCIQGGEDVNFVDEELARNAFPAASTLVIAMQSFNLETLRALLVVGADPNRLVGQGIAWELRNNVCPETEQDIPTTEANRFVEFKKRLDGGTEILRIFREFGFHVPGLQEDNDRLSFYDIRFRPAPPEELRDEPPIYPPDVVEDEAQFYFEKAIKTNWFPFPFPCQGTRPDALWHAATPGALREMVNAGADVNTRDHAGWTTLHHLASYGSSGYYFMPEAMMQILIDAGADINAVNEYGLTPMMLAAEAGWHNTRCLELIKVLLRNGADADLKEAGGGYTTLDWLVTDWNNMPDFIRPILAEIFNMMRDSISGAGLSAVNLDLMTAAFWGAPEDFEAILARGADINAQTVHGYTPLMFASVFNEAEPVKYLIENGALLNARNARGDSPLALAKRTHDRKVISVLRRYGAEE